MGAALLAAGVIIALASYGRRPDPSFAPFEAAGIMLLIPPETITDVVMVQGERRWRFERASPNGWVAGSGSPLGESVRARLDSGLRFLHVSAPQRVLQPQEVAGIAPSEFGLEPPRYSVSVRSSAAEPFNVDFGAPSPQGSAQYARVTGRAEILLLPRFIGEQWEVVMGAR
jgi:hypothetical protein